MRYVFPVDYLTGHRLFSIIIPLLCLLKMVAKLRSKDAIYNGRRSADQNRWNGQNYDFPIVYRLALQMNLIKLLE